MGSHVSSSSSDPHPSAAVLVLWAVKLCSSTADVGRDGEDTCMPIPVSRVWGAGAGLGADGCSGPFSTLLVRTVAVQVQCVVSVHSSRNWKHLKCRTILLPPPPPLLAPTKDMSRDAT